MKSLLLAATALLLLRAASCKFTLTLLHTNDVHARFEQMDKYGSSCSAEKATAGECFGGVARRKTKLDQLRKQFNNTLFLVGGDEFQGTLWFSIFTWKAVAYFTNQLGIDAMSLGNHEFDLGIGPLASFIDNVTFPVLSANIDTSQEPSIAGKFLKSTTKTVGGETIGLIGYTTVDTPKIADTGNLVFNDVATAIQTEVDELKLAGVTKIIAVGHAGYDVDLQTAKTVKGIDVIVGGHTDTFLYTGTPPAREKPEGPYPTVVTQDDGAKVLVVQDYTFGKYLGFLQVDFDDGGAVENWNGNPILLDKSIQEDPVMLGEINKWGSELEAYKTRVIARTRVLLDGERANCRLKECNMGNFLTDAMVYRNLAHPDGIRWAKASIAILNTGSIRTSINQGNITLEAILAVWPYRSTIDIVELKGKHLKEVLEHSVAEYDPGAGREASGAFLQVSGLIVTYDLSKPVGSRVASVTARCGDCLMPKYSPLEDEKVYSVLSRTFTIEGGDGFDMILKNAVKRHLNGDLDSDVFEEYARKMSPIFIGLEDRIRFVRPNGKVNGGCVNSAQEISFSYALLVLVFIAMGCFGG